MPPDSPQRAAHTGQDSAGHHVQGERRIVTALFCDVSGSTAIAEQLDPEEWAGILNEAFERLIACVYRYEGTVARLLGDAILAFFGAPTAHEDDPARAVLTGLAMIEAIAAYSQDIHREYGFDFKVRVGINTGLVVVGALGSEQRAEYTAVGDAVNVAARMEQTAEPGTVQIAHDTYRLVEGLFEVEALGAVEVRGKSEPVRAYRVLRAKPRPELRRGVPGLSAPLVGRAHQMAALRHAVDHLIAGRGQIVSVMGEAGLGKSRLLAELRQSLEAEGRLATDRPGGEDSSLIVWLEGRSLSYEGSTPYAPFIAVYRGMAGLYDGLSADERYARLKRAVARLMPDREEEVTPYLASMAGLPPNVDESGALDRLRQLDPQQLHDRIFDAVCTLAETLARRHPVVLVLDDLHWIDPTSLDLLLHLMPVTRQARLMLVALYRPRPHEFSWRYHERASEEFSEFYTCLVLEPLSQENTQTLVDKLLDDHELPEAMRRLILTKAEGNPFFVEEIVRSLVDAGWLARRDGRWHMTRTVDEIAVPDTLTGVITARLDRLDEASKRVIQTASVLGRAFAANTLLQVLSESGANGDETATGIEEILLNLERRELIFLRERHPWPVYMFKHVLTQETVYASLLLSRRRELHRRVAECLEREDPDRVNEIARHFLAARLPDRALPYFVAAGDRAVRAYAAREAIAQYTLGLEAAGQTEESPVYLFRARGRAHEMVGDFEAARADYEAALAAAQQGNDRHGEWQALIALGFLWASRDYGQAGGYYQKALALARAMNERATLAHSLNRVGNWHVNVDRPREGQRYHQEALEIWEELGEPRGLAETLDLLGLASYRSGDVAQAVPCYHRAIALFRELDDRQGLASCLAVFSLLNGIYLCNDVSPPAPLSAAERMNYAQESLQIAQAIAWPAGEAFAYKIVGWLYGVQGEMGQALHHVQNGLRIARTIDHHQWLCGANCVLGCIYTLLLVHEQARQHLEQALDMARALQSQLWTNIIMTTLAMSAYFQNDFETAYAFLDEISNWETPMESFDQRRCWAIRAELALDQGDVTTALEIIERLYASLSGVETRADVPYLNFIHGKALAALGRVEEARSLLYQVEQGALALGWHPFLWRIYQEQARLYHSQGLHDLARQAEEQARETARRIAATVPEPALGNVFLAGVAGMLARAY